MSLLRLEDLDVRELAEGVNDIGRVPGIEFV